ncbi:MAG: Hsp20/alpha crystallin family protein, partial [Chitinophagales bacterium]
LNVKATAHCAPTFNKFFDDFFKGEFPTTETSSRHTGVNISESDADFLIEVALPGLEKGDFDVNVEADVLTISAKRKADNKEEGEGNGRKYTRKEFNFTSFKRSFYLPENVNSDDIAANYNNGILSLSLPKVVKEEVKPKTIEIS